MTTSKDSESMDASWFFDENFNGVSDDFFDDLMKHADFPMEDVEPDNNEAEEEDWEAQLQNLQPPPANILSSDFNGDVCNAGLLVSERMNDAPSKVKARPGATSSSSRVSFHPRTETCEEKPSRIFQTSSPVSVLESSSSCSAENPIRYKLKPSIPVKRPRSKLPRRLNFKRWYIVPFTIPPTISPSRRCHPSAAFDYGSGKILEMANKKPKKKNLTGLCGSTEIENCYPPRVVSQQPSSIRKCTHCEVTKTPQWREGPNGPKTLCNACGVRYRSGRLLPEYRPAASPTFVASVHSNSHKKVIEMRSQTTSVPEKVAGMMEKTEYF